MKPVNLKVLQAKSKVLIVRVFEPARASDPYTAIVESSSQSTFNQVVTIRFTPNGEIRARCTCTWARYGGVACVHVIASLNKLAERKGRDLSFWGSQAEARRQKQRVFKLVSESGEVWITSRR
jgi:hypothetical protein